MKNRFSTYNSFYDYCVYENLIENNIIQSFQRRYLSKYKEDNGEQRRLISVEEMARFIHLIPDLRHKTIALLFAKTGIRRRELVAIDVGDINWENMSIKLKPTKKRSNLIVYFDYETALMLKRWMKKRELLADPDNQALFVSYINRRKRLNRNGVGYTFVKWAEIAGLHNSTSEKLSDKFTCHCCRHWYTTHLRRAGMSREFITELRGDKGTSAMDIYNHVDHEELKRTYLSCIPQLGID
jgi:integrase/recombinase XerD